jgi:uncharacterized protein YgiM (DUF1202 family)
VKPASNLSGKELTTGRGGANFEVRRTIPVFRKKRIFSGDIKMQSYTKIISLFILVCLTIPASIGLAAGADSPAASATAVEALSYPYIAEITDDNVNIRSGPGTNYYHCGKLNTGDKVKVVASRHSWSHIVPPAGSFSWISKQYVEVDPNNPQIGTVTGDSVRVYAGSDLLKPMHSTTVQMELNSGDKVELMGEEQDDYYKIAPPSGAYLWVLTQYTKPTGEAAAEITTTLESAKETRREVNIESKSSSGEAGPSVAAAPTIITAESEKLKEYYDLAEQIKAEKDKPLEQQDYTNIKASLAEIADNNNAGKAARYAEFAIAQIERYELAKTVSKEVQLQEAQMENIRRKIEDANAAKLSQLPDLGKFTAIGLFESSVIYGPEEVLKRYRILDESGQTVCYALPEGPASKMDLDKLVGKKVGIIGTVEPHPQTKGAMVRFTEIAELQ